MSKITNVLRPFLKCTRYRKRFYAAGSSGSSGSDEMRLTLTAANQVFYNQDVVKQVDVPSTTGDFGILKKHVPTLAILKPGVVSVYEMSGNVKRVFVSSGTITVNSDSSVQVLAEEAHPLESFDKSAIREILSKAQDQLNRAANEKEKAEAQIALEVANALNEAIK